jgi:hypothetical protein
MKKTSMKRAVTVYAFIAVVLSMTSLTANGATDSYLGSISPSTLGSPVTTTLPMFNSALGTLTGVQVTLDFTVTPYAQILNFSGAPRTFTPSDSVSHSYSPSPANIWTISHGTDSWTLAAPTVTTGPIYGTGQVVPNFTSLQFVGSTSAPANLTASGLDLARYIGAGVLVFGTSGPGQSSGTGPFFSGGGGAGGGANLAGTASVTYEYAPVPEPGTLALMACGLTGLLVMRRRFADIRP